VLSSAGRSKRATSTGLLPAALLVLSALLLPPIVGWPDVTRVSIVLSAGVLMTAVVARPWRWSSAEWAALAGWNPSVRTVWTTALVVGLLLFWIVLTRFQSGEVNAVDFTVYFDRPAWQTVQGRPMFVETTDDPLRAQQTYFAVHAHWVMLPLSLPYAIWPTPLWLLGLSVVAVVVGAGGLVASASALAFVLNDNTARTLNYGFHVEVLYAWLVPWMINAALSRHRWTFLAVTVACVMVKEDAVLLLAAVSIALALTRGRLMTRGDRIVYLVAPPLFGLLNLGVYYGYVVPLLQPDGAPFYANYWASYGVTPMRAVAGMLQQPGRVLSRTLTSGFFGSVLMPHLFLPLVGWRWVAGIVPIVLLYGASDNEQLRSYGIYYAIVLVPFLVLGAAMGALAIVRRLWPQPERAQLVAASAILAGALLAGLTDAGYSLRPWRAEIAAVPEAIARLADEPVILVQSGLYPHAGYEHRIQLLTPGALADLRYRGAAVLLAPEISAWPFDADDLEPLLGQPRLGSLPGGLIAVRLE
jgi:uncharacterized membrane protein